MTQVARSHLLLVQHQPLSLLSTNSRLQSFSPMRLRTLFLPPLILHPRPSAFIFAPRRSVSTVCRYRAPSPPPNRPIFPFNLNLQIPQLKGPSLHVSLIVVSVALISLDLAQLSTHSFHDLLQLAVPDALTSAAATTIFGTTLTNALSASNKRRLRTRKSRSCRKRHR